MSPSYDIAVIKAYCRKIYQYKKSFKKFTWFWVSSIIYFSDVQRASVYLRIIFYYLHVNTCVKCSINLFLILKNIHVTKLLFFL